MNNYPILINDSRLTPDLRRIRSGTTQEFQYLETAKRTFKADFTIEPPERHIYAELVDGQWFWVNGCDECHGREGSWVTYIKCEEHDVCRSCKIPRSRLTETPWGHPKGFECKSCHTTRREIEKMDALSKVQRKIYHEWDYEGLTSPTCPYCEYEYEPCHNFYEADDEVIECDRCDNKFKLYSEPRVEFNSYRIKE